MAFINAGGTVIAYADSTDVKSVDQRVFQENVFDLDSTPSGTTDLDTYLEDLCIRATVRVNERIRARPEWRQYWRTGIQDVPAVDPAHVVGQQELFSEMCAYYVLKEYLLPRIADFGNPESSEVQKIAYYSSKFTECLDQILTFLDWYDQDGNGEADPDEKRVAYQQIRRSRGRKVQANIR